MGAKTYEPRTTSNTGDNFGSIVGITSVKNTNQITNKLN